MPILSYLSNLGMGGSSAAAPTPVVVVSTPASEGSARRRHSFRYDRWGKKKKQARKASPEAVQIIEQIAEVYAQRYDVGALEAAVAALQVELRAEQIRARDVFKELLALELERLAYENDEDDDFMLLH